MLIKVVSEYVLIRDVVSSVISNEYGAYEIKNLDNLSKVSMEKINEINLICLIINKEDLKEMKLANELKSINKNIKIVVIDLYLDRNLLSEIIKYNIDGYIASDLKKEELLFVIKMILNGRKYYDSKVILDSTKKENHLRNYNLTVREKEVLNHIVEGFNNKDIAQYIKISENTVKKHVSNILNKLNFRNRKEVILHMKEIV